MKNNNQALISKETDRKHFCAGSEIHVFPNMRVSLFFRFVAIPKCVFAALFTELILVLFKEEDNRPLTHGQFRNQSWPYPTARHALRGPCFSINRLMAEFGWPL